MNKEMCFITIPIHASSNFCIGVDVDILLNEQIFERMFSKAVMHALWKQEGI